MRTALYFPHTAVRSESVVRTALLTWDQLEYIAPFPGYRPDYKSRDMARAMEVIGKARSPTQSEKKRVHELVEDLLRQGVPETFRYSPVDGDQSPEYEIWPQKLAHETWRLLVQEGLTQGRLNNMDYPTKEAAGLTLMAIVADVLAGTTRTRITDRGLAYATITNMTKTTETTQEPHRVVPLTFKGVGLEHVPLGQLIDFREREAKSTGSDYRALRHNYLIAVEKHIEQVSKLPLGSPDRIELDRAFAADMEDDLRDLKKELGFAKRDAWLSKDVMTLVLAGGALLTAATSAQFQIPEVIAGGGGIVVLGGLLGTANKLAKSRYDVLRKHPMAYLYQLTS